MTLKDRIVHAMDRHLIALIYISVVLTLILWRISCQ